VDGAVGAQHRSTGKQLKRRAVLEQIGLSVRSRHPVLRTERERFEGGGDRDNRPGKGESNDAVRPVNNGRVEQPAAAQPRSEVKQSAAEQPNSDVEKPQEQQTKLRVEQPKAEQPKSEAEKPKEQQPKPHVEKRKGEEKAKTE
jgi:hypothetical protein